MVVVFRSWLDNLPSVLKFWPLQFEFECFPTQNAFPKPLVIWAQLHEAGSNLAVCLCAGPELLGTTEPSREGRASVSVVCVTEPLRFSDFAGVV